MYKHKPLLKKYLKEYKAKPYSKKVFTSVKRFSEMYNPKSYMYGYRFMPGYVNGLKENKTLLYLSSKKLIKSFDNKKGKQVIVTSQGEKLIYNEYPLSQLRKQTWDGYWTIIMYDIPEKQRLIRDILRSLIKRYGFAKFQKSIYISPLNIGEGINSFFEGKSLEGFVQIYRGKTIFGLTNEQIANKVYKLEEINKLYKDLSNNYRYAVSTKKGFSKWSNYFLAVNYFDPYLPYELLPNTWEGDNCEKLFRGQTSKWFLKRFLKKYYDRSTFSESIKL